MNFDVDAYEDPEAADRIVAFASNCGLFSSASGHPKTNLGPAASVIACEIQFRDIPDAALTHALVQSCGSTMGLASISAVISAIGRDEAILRQMANDVVSQGSVTSSDVRPTWAMDLATDPEAVLVAAMVTDALAYAMDDADHEWMTEVSAMVADVFPYERTTPVMAPSSPHEAIQGP